MAGSYSLLTKEGMNASEDWRTNHAQPVERLVALDVWDLLVTKAWGEEVQVLEAWDLELNPAVAEFDRLSCDEAWDLVLGH